ncbi:MAG: RidA family protein [SAR202 cluster bacterium]|jgi:enamine deaminase RidA (YjgF/YER057c/UK114 family)|nr:enamine deaminase RidA [Chloroflexota bacterium]MDP6421215.1 RidA family protein [SAR202 cluster bacterium]HAL47454.1 enamine deaminase RidA [Dehalococcoidia bacterium]MDP6665331.1 RidA family protein [SAR202 cluster bacterium]MDP6799616.1 RidA family protein [SAR202 cluster bacterium]|tara:strand:+ start:2119 stop:2502 length:384 start_codon:yes stop_codon:yes gene_type:complete
MPRRSYFPNPNNKPAGFSPATRAGNFVFVSGQVGVDADGNLVGEGDCGAQSRQCFANVEAALAAAGATMSDVTKITAFLINAEDYPAYATARSESFVDAGPASSTVFVKGLVRPQFLVEIEATAVLL